MSLDALISAGVPGPAFLAQPGPASCSADLLHGRSQRRSLLLRCPRACRAHRDVLRPPRPVGWVGRARKAARGRVFAAAGCKRSASEPRAIWPDLAIRGGVWPLVLSGWRAGGGPFAWGVCGWWWPPRSGSSVGARAGVGGRGLRVRVRERFGGFVRGGVEFRGPGSAIFGRGGVVRRAGKRFFRERRGRVLRAGKRRRGSAGIVKCRCVRCSGASLWLSRRARALPPPAGRSPAARPSGPRASALGAAAWCRLAASWGRCPWGGGSLGLRG